MIISDEKNLIYVINHLPAVGNMLSLNWSCGKPSTGKIAGYMVFYDRAGKNRSAALEYIRGLSDSKILNTITRSGWISSVPTGDDLFLIWGCPVGTPSYIVHEETFCAPCSIEVWTVLERDEEIYLLCNDTPAYHLSLRLEYSIHAETFVPATYGWFGRMKTPAVSGVQLEIRPPKRGAVYEDGVVYYRLKSDPSKMKYPVPKEAVGKKINFYSRNNFQYRVDDFEVGIETAYSKMYEI